MIRTKISRLPKALAQVPVVAIGLVFGLVLAGPRRRKLEVLAGAFGVLMALSRVYLDVHWFADVATGFALRAAVMLGVESIIHEVGDRAAHQTASPGPTTQTRPALDRSS